MEALLTNFSETHRLLFYLFVFLGMFIEGEMVLVISGILVRSGSLEYISTLCIAAFAAFLHDIIFWFLGKKIYASGKKRVLIFNVEKTAGFLEKLGRNGWYIFASKFAWNFNRLVLLGSGYIGLPLKTLAKYSAPAAIIWTTTFLSLGYFFAHEADLLKRDIKVALALFTAFLIIIIILEKIFQWLFWKRNNDISNSGS